MSSPPMFSSVTLPSELDANDVLALRDQIGARIAAVVTKGKKRVISDMVLPAELEPIPELPANIERPWKRFDAAATELQTFLNARAQSRGDEAHAANDVTEQNAANTGVDDSWRAFEKWLGGAAGLAEDGAKPSPREASWLHTQLFTASEGLRFITWRPRAQWTAMGQRMTLLQESRAQAVIEGFHGARHAKQLAAAHARFGKAFGFTTAVIEPAGGPTDGRPQWVTCREALRTLIQKIENHADPDIEGSEPLATFLLGPYVETVTDLERSRRARAARKPDPTPTTPPDPSKTP